MTWSVTSSIPYDETTNATLKFSGDDGVWLFINNRLALYLGGVGPAVSGEVTVRGDEESFVNGSAAEHGMTPGKIKIFHAERPSRAPNGAAPAQLRAVGARLGMK